MGSQFRLLPKERSDVVAWTKASKAVPGAVVAPLTESQACLMAFYRSVLEVSCVFSLPALVEDPIGAQASPESIVRALQQPIELDLHDPLALMIFEILDTRPSTRVVQSSNVRSSGPGDILVRFLFGTGMHADT